MFPTSAAPFTDFQVLFPNWKRAPTATFLLGEWDDSICPNSSLTGMTILNYGTASGGPTGDITGVYWQYVCDAKSGSGTFTMTFAGVWNVGGSPYPAWTWGGSYGLPDDPCTDCWCYASLNYWTDIGPCPTDGATVALGPGYNPGSGEGGVTDNCPCMGPFSTLASTPKKIGYVLKKADKDLAAPGDTINYTVYYGTPGTTNISTIWIMDTQPAYTHYLANSSVPAPDFMWDPNPGPPMALRWTLNGPFAPGDGATREVRFQLTVDWGNKEWFEPGSGDVAAPENETLINQAQMSWTPDSGGGTCPSGRVSNTPATLVRRYLFWKLGDNDLLFANAIGSPPDEMIYSIFLKNLSASKTWHDVRIWDSVPNELDTWTVGYGIEDPCVGWTMTPSGCSPANAGVLTNGTRTILTWLLDMPPQATLQLRWKAHVKDSTAADTTAVNVASVMEEGKPATVGGTGHQGRPKNFAHVAPVKLRTTYISYVGIGGGGLGKRGLFITFYPLNKATNFELRGIEENINTPNVWVEFGGVSASIGPFIGSCVGGMAGGNAGCKAERAPVYYARWTNQPGENHIIGGYTYGDPGSCNAPCSPSDPCSDFPPDLYHHIYKLVSNSPILWQAFSCACGGNQDQQTYAPTTTLSFSGLMAYSFERKGRDRFNIMNTSVDAFGTLNPNLRTTIHMFTWEPSTLEWVYQQTFEVDKESQVMPPVPVCNAHYRFVSSEAKLVTRIGMGAYFGPDANNFAHMSPSRNEGSLVSGTAGEAFYIFPAMWDGYLDVSVGVTNMDPGAGVATYDIESYIPRNTINPPAGTPAWFNDTSGKWYMVKAGETVPGGFNTAANAHFYGLMYDNSYVFGDPPGSSGGVWRLTLKSGGPIQVCSGSRIYSVYSGGSLLSAVTGKQMGQEFWISEPWSWSMSSGHCDMTSAPDGSMYAVDIFCPKAGMVVRAEDTEGYDSTYTTNAADQCVAFTHWTDMASGTRRNIRFTISGGDAIAMYNHCQPSHKFFTAPFLEMGTHYRIITPPTVFIGQKFWITIVVIDTTKTTKTDYDGTTSFTSTDPGAEVELAPMESYDYNWSGAENGVKMFLNVTMTQLGLQTIVASDTLDGSIVGLATVMVVGVDVKLTKRPVLRIAASGEEVEFRICFSNYSSASATNFILTDKVPDGVTYVQDTAANHLCGSTKGFSGVTVAYSTTGNNPNDYQTMPGGGVPNATWLRWTIPQIGVNTTGCVCFTVLVD